MSDPIHCRQHKSPERQQQHPHNFGDGEHILHPTTKLHPEIIHEGQDNNQCGREALHPEILQRGNFADERDMKSDPRRLLRKCGQDDQLR